MIQPLIRIAPNHYKSSNIKKLGKFICPKSCKNEVSAYKFDILTVFRCSEYKNSSKNSVFWPLRAYKIQEKSILRCNHAQKCSKKQMNFMKFEFLDAYTQIKHLPYNKSSTLSGAALS